MKVSGLLVFMLFACTLNGQSSPGAYRSVIWGVELSAGSNFALGYNPILSRETTGGRTLLPGWRAGVSGTMAGRQSRSVLLLGLDVFRDRTDLLSYRQETRFFFDAEPDGNDIRFREGTLRIRETQLRVMIAHRITLNKFDVQYGLSASGRVGGEQVYDFQQTTTAWLDPVTGGRIAFEEPLVSNGRFVVPEKVLNDNTYLGLLLGGGYNLTPRLGVRLEWELGVHLRNGSQISNRYKQYHQRLGLFLNYGLFGE